MTRHRQAGDEFVAGGIQCRVCEGKKRPICGDGQDLVFQFRTAGGCWQQPGHEFVLALVHFMYENEEDLYPLARGFPRRTQDYRPPRYGYGDQLRHRSS